MTRQRKDRLYIEGRKYFLQHSILERFFRENPELKPYTGHGPTNLRRGFVAEYEVMEKELFVSEIFFMIPLGEDPAKYSIDRVFQTGTKASWFSGIFYIDELGIPPYQKNAEEIHTYFEVYEGEVKNLWKFKIDELEKFKEQQFIALKNEDPQHYAEIVLKWRKNNPSLNKEEIEKNIRGAILYFLKKDYH